MSARATTSQTVRSELVEALRLDLVGPDNDHPCARELLPEPPSRWYLTGFLSPAGTQLDDPDQGDDDIDVGGDQPGGSDDSGVPDKGAAKRGIMPSSLGVSVLVTAATAALEIIVEWGDYTFEGEGSEDQEISATIGEPGEQASPSSPPLSHLPPPALELDTTKPKRKAWRRTPKNVQAIIPIPKPDGEPSWTKLPGSDGLEIMTIARAAPTTGGLPAGSMSISVFLVNKRREPEKGKYKACVFQVRLIVSCPEGGEFVARTDMRSAGSRLERDEEVACVHYRTVYEYAVGHGVSATSDVEHGRRRVLTTWLPKAEVERVAPKLLTGITFGMEDLGKLTDGADAAAKLGPLVAQYRKWLGDQAVDAQTLSPIHQATTTAMLNEVELAARRIDAGIGLLTDPVVLEAFRIANRTMAAAGRQRKSIEKQVEPQTLPQPSWHPFQLAFILMTLRSIVEPSHPDRDCVDLLFFPTGGGKTEAYLGLAAFTMVLRRLRAGPAHTLESRGEAFKAPGMSVLMRYTLRLLTLDQLGRAAGLMCAMELERKANLAALGHWPFEIGLWVGKAATPNRIGDSKNQDPQTARKKTLAFQRNPTSPSPIPLEECPWCGTKFKPDSFKLFPNPSTPTDLHIYCANRKCSFTRTPLPIVAVDEPLYRRLPAFVIATVDKFASLPWTGQVGKFFGHAGRFDSKGFYNASDGEATGSAISGCDDGQNGLLPPELIIQDELHLISGPLGTIAGLYETALDALAARGGDDGAPMVLPKIVASTATVRRAEAQIRALFGRQNVTIFPPPGPNRRDSFFAETLTPEQSPARMYLGIAAQGRSLKVVLLRSALALLGAAQTSYAQAGGGSTGANPADPYMTLLGYFGSLRELGGSRRIIEDEVYNRLKDYGQRRQRLDPVDGLFTDRSINSDVLELTSRVPTGKVAEAKRSLAQSFTIKKSVDVALATNMISVGLDILRLGLMVVLGQPKTSAEYIQATSRVGRDPDRPGLVVTLLNIHKPRDRSHYERFESYHASFYRSVEATSVTPFSPRALDRALPAALVGLCRHGEAGMGSALGAGAIICHRTALDRFALMFARRAEIHRHFDDPAQRQQLVAHVMHLCTSLLDDWRRVADETRSGGSGTLIYQPWEESRTGTKLLHELLDPALGDLQEHQRRFRANRSMRDVEPTVELSVMPLHRSGARPFDAAGGGDA